jgi:hypothetical protein
MFIAECGHRAHPCWHLKLCVHYENPDMHPWCCQDVPECSLSVPTQSPECTQRKSLYSLCTHDNLRIDALPHPAVPSMFPQAPKNSGPRLSFNLQNSHSIVYVIIQQCIDAWESPHLAS